MTNRQLFRTGLTGAAIAAVCCFTPLLVWLFALAGVSWAVIYVDIIMIPALVFFIALALIGGFRLRQR
ncbi:mercury resistance system transport protein MerF [Ahrensia sp. R2A130]|uniref:mercury resistance system transport protein MerF n=1 Tax=Ahrensia sp. R2A130 TaxID=744979 RepID=UPI0001E0E900|nr:mercury resistance system transport protein MerF [Ahrensia sp. R2A130]EFL88026.1 ion transport transmembrane protein [Ahrensia sp. R2A130]